MFSLAHISPCCTKMNIIVRRFCAVVRPSKLVSPISSVHNKYSSINSDASCKGYSTAVTFIHHSTNTKLKLLQQSKWLSNYRNICSFNYERFTNCQSMVSLSYSGSLLNRLQHTSWNAVRHYAKGRDKVSKGSKGKKTRIDISNEDINKVVNNKEMMEDFDTVMEELKQGLVTTIAVRTNVGSIENLEIQLEGDTFPLNELAQVHRKSPQLLVINCAAFPQATKAIMEAITNSGMNLNPQQEATTIAVPLPKVTREHREELSKKAKLLCNKCKDNLRVVHNHYVRKAKNKDASEDLIFKVCQKLKELQDNNMAQAEAMLVTKQTELLQG